MSIRAQLNPALVDWRASVLAGLGAGTLFLILNLLIIPEALSTSVEVVLRYFASIVLGPGALGKAYGAGIVATALALHYLLSVVAAISIAYVVHRWGVVGGTIGGILMGLAIYLFNMYSLTYFIPWFFSMESSIFLILHLIFGGAAGAIYEMLERGEYHELQDEAEMEADASHG